MRTIQNMNGNELANWAMQVSRAIAPDMIDDSMELAEKFYGFDAAIASLYYPLILGKVEFQNLVWFTPAEKEMLASLRPIDGETSEGLRTRLAENPLAIQILDFVQKIPTEAHSLIAVEEKPKKKFDV